jgi:energy-coupling factor transporter ATP-binding protein EcfA2
MIIPKNYSLFDSSYGEEISAEQIFCIKYEKLPSSMVNKTTYNITIEDVLVGLGFVALTEFQRVDRGELRGFILKSYRETLYQLDSKEILIKIKKNKDKKDITFIIYYSLENGPIQDQIDLKVFQKYVKRKKRTNISLIKSQGNGYLDLEDYEMSVPPMNLTLNYGEEFKKIHETIVSRLNRKDDKGIVLLHGSPGTGKTTYIKYLTTLIKDKTIIFVPPMMAESLTDPSIIPFLMDYKNSILIIEDAERVLGSRESGTTSQSTSNLLNLTDGILGDCLSIQIVATFNTKRDNIDDAFMRKGRLIAEHKFEKLSIEETNVLLKHLNKDIVVDEEMALSDIYNIDTDVHKSIKEKSKIGFN